MASIPGIDKATIAAILAELDDLGKFKRVRELVAFIGLAPKETLSGTSVKAFQMDISESCRSAFVTISI